MELKQTLKIQQKLIMTPQLQQAIHLLQITRNELIELINAELESNPLLETEPEIKNTVSEAAKKESVDGMTTVPVEHDYPMQAPFLTWGEEDRKFESKKEDSLYDHLLWQLNVENFSEEEKVIGKVIIGNIEEDGYIRIPMEEIARELGCTVDKVNSVLLKIQELEPPGIAARNLQECLLIQVKQRNINNPLVKEIIKNYLNEIETCDLQKLCSKLNASEEDLKEAIKIIKSLNPKPGLTVSPSDAVPIIPDVIVKKVGDDYEVMVNKDGIPELKINNYYNQLLNSAQTPSNIRDFLLEKKRAIEALRQGILKRENSILKVAKSIVKHQRDFFDKGIEYLKPLVLREIAEDTNLHESTVSRICRGKYMETHFGIFEMKKFFSTRINTSSNTEMSGELLKMKIKSMIENENPKKPLTDREIAEKLAEAGINIARRTVVKYREQLNIPSARERKRY